MIAKKASLDRDVKVGTTKRAVTLGKNALSRRSNR